MTSRFLWGKSVAAYRDGYGVTLLRGKKAAALQAEKYPLAPEAEGPDFLAPGDSALTERLAPIAKALVDDHAYNGTPFAFVVLHEGKVVAERYREGITARTRLLSWSQELHERPGGHHVRRRDGGHLRPDGHSRVAG